MKKAIESYFPFEKLDPIAEVESYRKEVYRPNYHIHKWWAQRLGSVFRAIVLGANSPEKSDIWKNFYQKHDSNGKVILDPFMGSGTTLGEALKLGYKAVGCDINPISTFIVKQSLKKVSIREIYETFNQIEKEIKSEIQELYTTLHPTTGETCQVLYYFWVKTIKTPEGEEIPLFSNYVFSKHAYPSKKPQSKILCPFCWSILNGNYNLRKITCCNCKKSFNPQTGPVKGQFVFDSIGKKHRIIDIVRKTSAPLKHQMYAAMILTPSGEKEYISISAYDRKLYKKICLQLNSLNFQHADMPIHPGYNTNQAINYNYTNWRQFFNERQLLALGKLFNVILKIKNANIRDIFLCLFSGTLEFNNMFCSFKGEGTGAVRHLFYNHILKPERTPLENSVWGTSKSSGTFSTLFNRRILKCLDYNLKPFELSIKNTSEKRESQKVYCNNPISPEIVKTFKQLKSSSQGCLILNGDSSKLPIPDCSVDSVVTDPPYFDFVHYSELADFFYAWLSPVLNRKDGFQGKSSRKKGEVQSSDFRVFSSNLTSVFAECYRVLKKDGILSFSFHHSRIEGWQCVYDSIISAGFHISAVHPVKAEMSVAAPKSSSKSPINLDAILVCRKGFPLKNGVWKNVKANTKAHYNNCLKRLEKVKRNLSELDSFVIYVSSLLCQCSKFEKGVYSKAGLKLTIAEMLKDLEISLGIYKDYCQPSSFLVQENRLKSKAHTKKCL